MIRSIYSSLSSFKTLEFHHGLNVLIAKKEDGATEKQTRNRAGKTSLIEIIHFLTGADAGKDSLFRSPVILNESFSMNFDLREVPVTVTRSGKDKAKVRLTTNADLGRTETMSNTDWTRLLGEKMFNLPENYEPEGRSPSFRSLFAYFVRRQKSNAFTTPEKQAGMQQAGDLQIALLFLLGLDWQIAREWQKVRDREKTLKELGKAATEGAFDALIGKASELRTQLTVAEAKLQEMESRINGFRVLPDYAIFEAEADDLTRDISSLSNSNVVDAGLIRDLETALASEAPPSADDLESIYQAAGISLPGVALRRYDEVRAFHESVIRNRRDYLQGELAEARQRVVTRERQKAKIIDRLGTVMDTLKNFGALDQFAKLQAEAGRQAATVETLRQRFAAAEQIEGTKNELEIERSRLRLRLRREFSEQRSLLSEAILAFEETSQNLYESAGSMTVEETANGPGFNFPIQGSGSKGIRNMQIFCFDMMLMRLSSKRNTGPGFLVHDSHLFDGVDGRQIMSALKVGAQAAADLGFQYIVTMNEDDAYKESVEGFNIRDHVLPVMLTDSKEDGGLFGVRF